MAGLDSRALFAFVIKAMLPKLWMGCLAHAPELTQSAIPLVRVAIVFFAAPPDAFKKDVHVAENDERWREDGAVVERHDELISLELPYLVGDGFDFEEGVAVRKERLSHWI